MKTESRKNPIPTLAAAIAGLFAGAMLVGTTGCGNSQADAAGQNGCNGPNGCGGQNGCNGPNGCNGHGTEAKQEGSKG